MTQVTIETVGEVMTERLVTVRPDTPVAEVYALMDEHRVQSCPVVTEAGELRGMVSRVDLLRALHPSRELRVLGREAVTGRPVRELMRCGVVTLEPGDPLAAAVDLFIDTRLHALPVVRRGAGQPVVLGVVTQEDVLQHLMRGAEEGRP